jgi:PIN domain nuclease of toxin-antitoxin system
MKLLLDTHALIWFLDGNEKITGTAISYIENSDNSSFVSIATIWEIAIKISLNKLQMKTPFKKLSDYIAENGFQMLHIQFEHAMQVSTLDFHHRDPFDRILISQGIIEKMSIISRDQNFDAYPVQRIW